MREPDALDDAVARADLFRSRQAAFGAARDPEALRFAASVVTRDVHGVAQALRSAICRSPNRPRSCATTRTGSCAPTPPSTAWRAPAGDADLFGMRLSQILSGPDRDARLLRTDGNTVGVGVVRFGPLDGELAVVALVERGEPRSTEGRVDRTWAAELERLARAGDLELRPGDGVLARSDTLEELYRDVGLDADDPHGAASSAGRPTRCGRRWPRARRTPTTTSSCTCPATCCCPAGRRSNARPTARRCASSASCAT